jgi:hypothetical protein
MSQTLPSPLLIEPSDSFDARVVVSEAVGCDFARAGAFGAALAESRERRGLLVGPVTAFASESPLGLPPPAPEGRSWVPHVYCWREPVSVSLAWEQLAPERLGPIFESSLERVQWWAERPALLLTLAKLAADSRQVPAAGHLSLRWVLANEHAALATLSAASVELEHVSVWVTPAEEARLVDLLERIGLIEVPRPASLSVPGCWLQAGATRVHLNSRESRSHEPGFPGTAPNHICFAVADLPGAVAAAENAGFATARVGSLGAQVWFRLQSGTVIEPQQLAPATAPPSVPN